MALLRYQLALLGRSYRWLAPALLYAAVVVAGSFGGMPLADGLGWSSAALVPAVGWLTRSALTAEPGPARACLATAGGPRRAQLATLTAALVVGVGLGLVGAGFELVITQRPLSGAGQLAPVELALSGVAAGVTCLLVGSAIGALCNPPLIRHRAYAVISTAAVAIAALAASGSPANAAIRATSAAPGHHLPWVPVLIAVIVAALTWTASVVAAPRRAG
ncbi:MAG TPA: hypothetical protein VN847_13505 [Streptosporangiaceae bacterium]|nr:hypothetical protein [Streptosporangiaceae bacterium]